MKCEADEIERCLAAHEPLAARMYYLSRPLRFVFGSDQKLVGNGAVLEPIPPFAGPVLVCEGWPEDTKWMTLDPRWFQGGAE